MRRVSLVSLLLAGLLLLAPGAARADDPPYVGWTELLPAVRSLSQCTNGQRSVGR